VNLAGALSIHRAILANQALAQRRSFYEMLCIITYLVALALCLFSVVNWAGNYRFVILCTGLWVLFCIAVLVRLWWINPVNKNDPVLEFPDNWEDMAEADQHNGAALAKRRHAAALAASMAASTNSNVQELPLSSFDKLRARAANLKRYKHARLVRYEKKRSTTSPAKSNLSTYVQKRS